jgi:exodeoxyribonuclease VII large subunit
VQGEQAPAELVSALRMLAREPGLEVAIVARGGGAAEDLQAFNDERVARAIFGFPVPVVSGVGHETDETITDLVADVRAPTPSAAAERATPDILELRRAVAVVERAMASAARQRFAEGVAAFDGVLARLGRALPDPADARREVDTLVRALDAAVDRRSTADRARLEHVLARMAGLDPYATLKRGFAIVQDAQSRKVVTSARKVKPGQRLSVSVVDGAFWTEVS